MHVCVCVCVRLWMMLQLCVYSPPTAQSFCLLLLLLLLLHFFEQDIFFFNSYKSGCNLCTRVLPTLLLFKAATSSPHTPTPHLPLHSTCACLHACLLAAAAAAATVLQSSANSREDFPLRSLMLNLGCCHCCLLFCCCFY